MIGKTSNLWNGVEKDVAVLGMGRRPLIGTALLEDCHLSIDFCDGGAEKPGLGLEFLGEVEDAVNFLMLYPEAGSKVRSSVRRVILPKFSYSLLYRILEGDLIRILAVAHHKRRTQYWVEREWQSKIRC